MTLKIEDPEVERLATEVARMCGETKVEAIRHTLEERKVRLLARSPEGDRRTRIRDFLENEFWPLVRASKRGRRLTRKQQDAILGYGPDGA